MVRLLSALLLVLLAACGSPSERGEVGPVVLAAASLQEALTEAAAQWAGHGQANPVLSFAASPALARQAIEGAPADMFVSADEDWMDAVEEAGEIVPGSRAPLARNRLVLIAPAQSEVELALAPGVDLAAALGSGRLAIADPDAVPAGRYGKAALTRLGAWETVADHLAVAENVRTALALVERGEAPLGIVYASDARASAKVRVVSTFPEVSHPPIVYPLARLQRGSHPEAEAFRSFLLSSEVKAIFARHGFVGA